jgi:predicted cobalt transporter CbtA
MSRTPETIINKPAQVVRAIVIGLGIFFALAMLGAFQNEGQNGLGLLFGLFSFAAFWLASKIKVTWHKKAEAGVYK